MTAPHPQIEVKTPPAFHVFYATGWEDSRVLVRQVNKHGQPLPGEVRCGLDDDAWTYCPHTAVQEWRELPMYNTRSRARPQGGFWKSSVVPMRMTAAAAQLQFRITNGHGAFDPARHEQFYTCPHPGGFKLQGGQMRPFRQATDARREHWNSAGHCLKGDEGKTLHLAAHYQEVRLCQDCRYVECESEIAHIFAKRC